MKEIRQKLDELYCRYKEEFNQEEIVLGDGCLTSPIVIVGEAPGKDEVMLGRPFVGAAGKNLNEFINVLGIDRDALFITNAIKYRLGKLNPKTQRIINRPATNQDIRNNQKWLHDEINILKPQIIVTLGNVPLKSIMDDFKVSIGDMHGIFNSCNVSGNEFKLFPLYHPASIIYNRALKEVYYNDVLKLKNMITEFFT
ncbi:uracil-DNA glycosylase [Ruminiclostridium herbifermentans]|uniref:Uracil-DNA glycosylase n=1 Tax=Ruminiclostridium herbifermentans TaxID=2488810 RepID=A0A4V6ENI1_9FIRM|nr:uracil-DNA glycosylase [Ruminiclostridium herbifermentans]QNU67829.1 uracil-DNA glycosylase [Ruminiclostridium herbifermentans]